MLKGTLDDFTLPDIFRLMSLAKKTGRMDVSRGAGEGRVFFNEGDVYYAESSLSREPLGQKLIRARALTESQLNKALDTHAQTGRRVGDIMIESGMVTSDQIEAAVAQQIEDAVFDLLRWDLGEFTWETGAELDVEVPISVSVENLIMEASRRLDELEVIQRKIPGEHAVLMMAQTPPEGAAEINITPEEWRALVLVDGSRTLGEIGRMIGKDDFETMKILYGLVSAGLVEVDQEASVAAAEAAEAEVEEVAEAEEPAPEAALEVEEPAPEVEEPALEVEEPALEVVGAEPEVEPEAAAEPEVEVVAAEPEPTGDLEDFPAGAPAATVEEPGPEEVAVPEAEAEPAEVGPETGAVGEEPVGGELDVTADEVLAGVAPADEVLAGVAPADEVAVDEGGGPEDVEVAAAADTTPDLMDVLEVAPEPQAEVEVPAFEGMDEAPAGPEEEAPAAETVSVGDAEDPFLSDLLDQDAAADAPEEVASPPAEPAAEEVSDEGEGEVAPSVDRAAVVRELAGLFDEDRPKGRPTGASAPPAPGPPADDERKRVEDDEQINKGVISRLIKGVKGL
jgi:hypothetical protein